MTPNKDQHFNSYAKTWKLFGIVDVKKCVCSLWRLSVDQPEMGEHRMDGHFQASKLSQFCFFIGFSNFTIETLDQNTFTLFYYDLVV